MLQVGKTLSISDCARRFSHGRLIHLVGEAARQFSIQTMSLFLLLNFCPVYSENQEKNKTKQKDPKQKNLKNMQSDQKVSRKFQLPEKFQEPRNAKIMDCILGNASIVSGMWVWDVFKDMKDAADRSGVSYPNPLEFTSCHNMLQTPDMEL